MGNTCCNGGGGGGYGHHHQPPQQPEAASSSSSPNPSPPQYYPHSRSSYPPPPPSQQPEAAPNCNVFAASSSSSPNPNPPQYYPQYGSSYPPPPPYDHNHRGVATAEYPPSVHHYPGWAGSHPYGLQPPMPTPYIPTVRNDVNLKKQTLRIEPDENCPGRFLVTFTFDAIAGGSMIVYFFAKEELNCNLTATKPDLIKPVTVSFKEGLGQKFRQPSGTGIDFSAFEDSELLEQGGMEVYPLVVKAEITLSADPPPEGEDQNTRTPDSQITQAVFEKKESGDYSVRVVRQILWVNGIRYQLQEIYGIGNSVEGEAYANDPGKECVICLSEPRDTVVLPCRHMCMCSECAKVLRYQTTLCPICHQLVEQLVQIKVNNKSEEQPQQASQSPPLLSSSPLHKEEV